MLSMSSKAFCSSSLRVLCAHARTYTRTHWERQGWTTDNGDYCAGLWSEVVLSGTRCADGHTLLCGIGTARLRFTKEMDLSGVSSISDDTLAVVAEQCPALQILHVRFFHHLLDLLCLDRPTIGMRT